MTTGRINQVAAMRDRNGRRRRAPRIGGAASAFRSSRNRKSTRHDRPACASIIIAYSRRCCDRVRRLVRPVGRKGSCDSSLVFRSPSGHPLRGRTCKTSRVGSKVATPGSRRSRSGRETLTAEACRMDVAHALDRSRPGDGY
jgi:hypothetical protein